jgi:hypothetical protein
MIMTTAKETGRYLGTASAACDLVFPSVCNGEQRTIGKHLSAGHVTPSVLFVLLECTAFWLFVRSPFDIGRVVDCILSFGMAAINVFAVWLFLNSRM